MAWKERRDLETAVHHRSWEASPLPYIKKKRCFHFVNVIVTEGQVEEEVQEKGVVRLALLAVIN